MRAMLLGEDHPALGEIALLEPHPGVGLALSAGHFPKLPPSVDANEDAVLAAASTTTALLAVADGHHGFAAARASIAAIHHGAADLLADASTARRLVVMALQTAAAAVAAAVGSEAHRSPSRTALTVAAVERDQIATATIGDTVALLVGGRRPKILGKPTPFLDGDTDPGKLRVHLARLEPEGSLVLMSDGAFQFLGRHWPRRVADTTSGLEAGAAADALVQAAFAAGAGDHVAVAVLRQRKAT